MNNKTSFDQMKLLGLSSAKINLFFPSFLRIQLDHIIDLYSRYNQFLPEEIKRSQRSINFVRHFYASFLIDRNRRAHEVKNGAYDKVVEKSRKILPTPTFFVICMDGRVKIIHIAGFPAGTASAIRTPGGALNEFIRIDGNLTLEPNSTFARKLLDASRKAKYTTQIFDSHLFCAARAREEAATGNQPADAGLFRDVIHKKEMIKAVANFLKREDSGNNVLLLQTSFNPVTGYLYMGLETDFAIKYAKAKTTAEAKKKGKNVEMASKYAEYTKETIAELIKAGKIIATGELISHPKIKREFEANWFSLNREERFVEDSGAFFEKIGKMYSTLSPILQKKVLEVYPMLKSSDERSRIELKERIIVLLTNAFNTFLSNRTHHEMEYLGMSEEHYEEEGHYKYCEHTEEGVKVSEGGHPPYDIPMFVIYGEDIENLSSRIELSSQLVRGNRKAQRVKDSSGQYTNPEEFSMAPVPVVMQEIIRNEKNLKIAEQDWKQLETVDWSDLPKNWDSMADEDFNRYLTGKGLGNFLLFQGIGRLRRKMARIYDPSQETSSHLKDFYKTALPIVCDEGRQTHAIIPFLKVARPGDYLPKSV